MTVVVSPFPPRTTPVRLRSRREAAGLTREQLAVLAGLTSRTVLRAELGHVIPTPATLRCLAAALECEVADLQDGNGAPSGAAGQDQREKAADASEE